MKVGDKVYVTGASDGNHIIIGKTGIITDIDMWGSDMPYCVDFGYNIGIRHLHTHKWWCDADKIKKYTTNEK